MEQNDFDEILKKKLDQRIIEPSSESWSRLSERLSKKVEPKRSKAYWWIAAACLVLGLFFGADVLKSSSFKEEKKTNKLVNYPNRSIELEVNSESQISHQEEMVVKIENPEEIKNEQTDLNVANNTKVRVFKGQERKQLMDNQVDKVFSENSHTGKLSFEEQKIQEVVAQVRELKRQQDTVSDADIDALLLNAQNAIAKERINNELSAKVDANALLKMVEGELDQSFRVKVLEAIKESYNTVKTAVAQRN
ncbi:hypothetical protein [Cognatitamlana onchidii]|uniref:hypothetical protein n=1 Tax=Cognatitamlana onchidii TaxID=2562860 RepID=UPI0010A64D54|nr:hypothetical protein [Algibacter onchidii]